MKVRPKHLTPVTLELGLVKKNPGLLWIIQRLSIVAQKNSLFVGGKFLNGRRQHDIANRIYYFFGCILRFKSELIDSVEKKKRSPNFMGEHYFEGIFGIYLRETVS